MIELDAIIFALQRQGGISVYFRELIARLQRDRAAAIVHDYGGMPPPSGPVGGAALLRRSRRWLERYRTVRTTPAARLLHSSYYRLPAAPLPLVTTVYDFIYERTVHGPRSWVHRLQKAAAVRRSQRVICISESTRSDLEHHLPGVPQEHVRVIPLAASAAFRVLEPALRAPQGRPYLLFVGQRGGYKNFPAAVAALHGLPADVELRCVGGGAWGDGEHEALPAALRPRVRHLGYVDDEGLNHLYNRALALVYPSRVEGFGIPVLEAMQAACPVVSGPCAALQEVGGEALVAAPSFEGEAIAHALTGLLDDAERARRIQAGQQVAARYSWERTYQETLAVYRELQ